MTIFQDRKMLLILTAILILVGFVQAQNMFQFPYYHHDEGTNFSNGWAVADGEGLSPYTYSYEDPPAGSVLLSAWTVVTGGPFAFGFSLNSGRVLMLIFHIMTAGLIYLIAKKLSKSDLASITATLVFAFSPLATVLQRIVVLDNIMVVWLLTALFLILGDKRKLTYYFASAFFFGLAVMTRGGAIFFLPAFFYIISLSADRHHKRFATTLWISIAILLIFLYPLYALMKEELFPEGWFLGGDFPHVSLLERLQDRGPDTGRFLNYGSGLGPAFEEWTDLSNPTADPVLIYAGLVCAAFVLVLAFENRELRPLVAMLFAEGLHLVFGGPVYNIDAILLLPFLALSVGILTGKAVEFLNRGNNGNLVRYGLSAGAFALLLYPFWTFNSNRLDVYTKNQVEGQIAATEWVKENVPEGSVVVTDNFAFLELRDAYPNVQNYWRVDTDPAVRFGILADDLCNIDYVIATPQVFADINTFNMDLMQRTVEHSEALMTYANNGWPVEIRQVNKTNCASGLASNSLTGSAESD